MSPFTAGLLLGLAIGAMLGVFVMALVSIARGNQQADDDAQARALFRAKAEKAAAQDRQTIRVMQDRVRGDVA